jgi:aldehyde dehydrogenase family 7 protein A1
MEEHKFTYSQFPFLKELGLEEFNHGFFDGKNNKASGEVKNLHNPSNHLPIASIQEASLDDYENGLKLACQAKSAWAEVPMPKRGEILLEIATSLKKYKGQLGKLIALEVGKIVSEGEGEVNEFIKICEFAAGLTRTIVGKIIPSERVSTTIFEQWNPLGIVGVITAFNFPNAVFGRNFCLSFICGNCTVWKGASSTGLTTIATSKIIQDVLIKNKVPQGVFISFSISGNILNNKMISDPRYNLISFTGSTDVGKKVSLAVHQRLGRTILELGGNNAILVCEDADLDMAIKSIVVSAVGTTGQRCTAVRRAFIHESLYDEFKTKVLKIYRNIKIGNPFDESVNMGPLHTNQALKNYQIGMKKIESQGGNILFGGKLVSEIESGNFVYPTLVEIDHTAQVAHEELFAPVLYIFKFKTIDEAISYNNEVPHGLASAIFTNKLNYVFQWIGPRGSDTGLINVNTGTTGSEVGGAYGGEKESGSGRETGSDAWKQYMRQSTIKLNYGTDPQVSTNINFNPKE